MNNLRHHKLKLENLSKVRKRAVNGNSGFNYQVYMRVVAANGTGSTTERHAAIILCIEMGNFMQDE